MAKTPITVGCTVKVSDHRHAYLTTIVRETKTQWITEKGQRFNKGTLRLVGQRDPWTRTTIRAVTEGEAAEFRSDMTTPLTIDQITAAAEEPDWLTVDAQICELVGLDRERFDSWMTANGWTPIGQAAGNVQWYHVETGQVRRKRPRWEIHHTTLSARNAVCVGLTATATGTSAESRLPARPDTSVSLRGERLRVRRPRPGSTGATTAAT